MFTTAGAALRTTGEIPDQTPPDFRVSDATVNFDSSVLLWTAEPVTPPNISVTASAVAATQVGV